MKPSTSPSHVAAALLPDRWAAEDPERLACFDGTRRLTRAVLADRVARCAAGLIGLGVAPGQTVSLVLPDRVEFVIALLGALRAGAVVQPLDPGAGIAENRRSIAEAQGRVVITSARHASVCGAAAPGGAEPICVLVDEDGGATGGLPFATLLDVTPLTAEVPRPLDALALVLYTSGSAGAPKRIDFTGADLLTDAAHLADGAGLGADDVIVCTAPLNHSYGLDSGLFLALWTGAPLCMPPADRRPFAARAAEAMALADAVGARVLVAVPVQLDALSQTPGGGFSTLRHAFSTGSPLDGRTHRRFLDRFGVAIRSLYGSTEIGTMTGDMGDEVDPATVGRPLPGVELRLVDADGRPVPAGSIGEIEVRSRVPLRRYAIEPEAALRGGWYHTGDRGHLDPAGRLRLDGRSARFVDVAGYKVDPHEVEALLADQPGVDEVAVVAVGRDGGVILEAAFAGPAPPESLRRACQDRLAPYKVPARFTRLAALPRSAAGKVRRRALVEQLAVRADDALVGVPPSRRTAQALAWVGDCVAAQLGHRPKPDAPLYDVGLDSAGLVTLAGRLSELFGRAIAPVSLFDHPTPRALAEWLSGKPSGAPAAASDAGPGESPGRSGGGDAIAIVAMACRLPGGLDDPDAFWQALDEGRVVVGDYPRDRGWDLEALLGGGPGRPGTIITPMAGFVASAPDFDAAHFDIEDADALTMDPQHRVLLELTWEAFERAGLPPDAVAGSDCGLYIGLWQNGYDKRTNVDAAPDARWLLGNDSGMVGARIAYSFDLRGPVVAVNTTCSSSMVAVHQACRALRAGECSRALAGGVTLQSNLDDFIAFTQAGIMSPTGLPRPFAAGADGAIWSEGAAVLLLERLSDARREGHPILAVIRGTAVNHDGRTPGLTTPSGTSQQRVIRAALADAELPAAAIDAVEAHGLCVPWSDAIEGNALMATYGRREGAQPTSLGAVSGNLGHTQAASGAVRLIKMTLALQHERLPMMPGLDRPTEQVDWAAGGLRLLDNTRPWPRGARVRRAGLSSFGVSGTNAHVILEEAPRIETRPPQPLAPTLPVLVSGSSLASLRAQARRWADWLSRTADVDLDAVRRTAALGRGHLTHRASIDPSEDLEGALRALAEGTAHHAVCVGVAERLEGVLFVVPEANASMRETARHLAMTSPLFAASLNTFDMALGGRLPRPVSALIGDSTPTSPLADIEARAVHLAMTWAMAALWRHAGVEPDAVSAHPGAEVAAAVIAGDTPLGEGIESIVSTGVRRARRRPDIDPRHLSVKSTHAAGSHRVIIDLGTGSTLDRSSASTERAVIMVASIDEEIPGAARFHRSLGALHVAGLAIDWRRVLGSGPMAALPTYAFQRRRYWLD